MHVLVGRLVPESRIVVSVWDTISLAQLCLILLELWSVPVGRPSIWAIDGSGTPCKVLMTLFQSNSL